MKRFNHFGLVDHHIDVRVLQVLANKLFLGATRNRQDDGELGGSGFVALNLNRIIHAFTVDSSPKDIIIRLRCAPHSWCG